MVGENIRHTPGRRRARFHGAERHQRAHDFARRVAAEYQRGGGGGGPAARGRIAPPGVFHELPTRRRSNNMKLAIVGYGKMGRLIEQLAPEYGFTSARAHRCRTTISRRLRAPMWRLSSPRPTRRSAISKNWRRWAFRRWSAPPAGWSTWIACAPAVEKNGSGAGVESEFFHRRERVSARGARSRAAAGRTRPEYGAWAWEIHHDTKKDAPRERCSSWWTR